MVDVFLLGFKKVALVVGGCPYVMQIYPSWESIVVKQLNESFDFVGDF